VSSIFVPPQEGKTHTLIVQNSHPEVHADSTIFDIAVCEGVKFL